MNMTAAPQANATLGSGSSAARAGRDQFKRRVVHVAGKPFIYGSPWGSELGADTEFESIAQAGWIRVTSIGSENLYFKYRTDEGEELPGYCKCL